MKSIEVSFTNFGKKGRDWCREKNLKSIVDEQIGVVGTRFGFNVAASAGANLSKGS